jgi:L-Ala-D/L-Glu epimerase
MIISGLEILPYTLPLKKPFPTSYETIHSRTGFLVRILDEKKNAGFGDAAPFPEAGTEDYRTAFDSMHSYRDNLLHTEIDERDLRGIYRLVQHLGNRPSTRHALEQALLDLICKRLGISLPVLLKLDPVDEIPVNGVIGLESKENTLEQVRNLIRQGYKTIKIKIGRDINENISTIRDIREIADDIRIRLDANASWTLTEAENYFESLEGLGIEYVEQPLTPGLEKEAALLRESTSVPIALDESIRTLDSLISAHSAHALDVAVLKPMVCGGILETIRLMHACKEYGIPVVISSSFESTIGWLACVLLAASSGSHYAHGLATQELYERNVSVSPLKIENGNILNITRQMFTSDQEFMYET